MPILPNYVFVKNSIDIWWESSMLTTHYARQLRVTRLFHRLQWPLVQCFSKVTWIISPLNCHLRFSIVVLETFKFEKTGVACSQYLELNHTCVMAKQFPYYPTVGHQTLMLHSKNIWLWLRLTIYNPTVMDSSPFIVWFRYLQQRYDLRA